MVAKLGERYSKNRRWSKLDKGEIGQPIPIEIAAAKTG
jgi:hypothetical protein